MDTELFKGIVTISLRYWHCFLFFHFSMPPKRGSRKMKAPCRFVEDHIQPARKRTRNIDTLYSDHVLVQPQQTLRGQSNQKVETMLQELVQSVATMQQEIKELKQAKATTVQGIQEAGRHNMTFDTEAANMDEEQHNSRDTSNMEDQRSCMHDDLDLMSSITRQSAHQITGEGTQARGSQVSFTSNTTNTHNVISAHIPLSALAKPSIKADIWANKYVDLAALLTPDQQTSYELVCEQPDPEVESTPQFKWTQKRLRPIRFINQWTDAFNAFIAIYCEKYPLEGPNLMKYMATVRRIAQKKGDWATYDTKFRKLKELQPQLGWQTVQNELYQEARLEFVQGDGFNSKNEVFSQKQVRARNRYQGKLYGRFSEGMDNYTKGYQTNYNFRSNNHKRGQGGNSYNRPFRRDLSPCWRYNRGKYCWGCSRPHTCTRCRADHPRRDCPLLQTKNVKDRSPSPYKNTGKGKDSRKHVD